MAVEQITKLTIDGTEYQVADCSEQVQNLVALYNDWRVQEAEARSKYIMVTTAIRGLGAEIVQTIKKEQTESEQPSEVEETPSNNIEE